MSTEIGGAEKTPPPNGFLDCMESFLDLDPFLHKISDFQLPFPQASRLVNKDNEDPDTQKDGAEHLTDINFDDAWSLLNGLDANPTDTLPKFDGAPSSDNLQQTTSEFVDTPVFLANIMDLPFDISTPDLDPNLLTEDIPELFSKTFDEELNSIPANVIQEQPSTNEVEISAVENNQPTSSSSITKETSSQASSILTLNIGNNNDTTNNDSIISGKGAQLQLKRKATKSLNYSSKVAIRTVDTVINNPSEGLTIVITLAKDSEKIEDSSIQVVTLGNEKHANIKNVKENVYEDKYTQMRIKNNEASRRCRQNRKDREKERVVLVEELEIENRELKAKVKSLESEIQEVKSHLIKLFSK